MTFLAPSTPERFLIWKLRPLLVYKHDIRRHWRSSKAHLPLSPADHGVLPPATRRQRGTLLPNVLLEKARTQIRSSFIFFTPDAFLLSHREDLCLLAHLDSLGCRCCEIQILVPLPSQLVSPWAWRVQRRPSNTSSMTDDLCCKRSALLVFPPRPCGPVLVMGGSNSSSVRYGGLTSALGSVRANSMGLMRGKTCSGMP